jgi:hypothetical protein
MPTKNQTPSVRHMHIWLFKGIQSEQTFLLIQQTPTFMLIAILCHQ